MLTEHTRIIYLNCHVHLVSEVADVCVTEEPCSLGSASSVTPSICHPAFFTSPPCFMGLCPFLIRVTDRRSAEKDGENERASGDFVTACTLTVGVGVSILRCVETSTLSRHSSRVYPKRRAPHTHLLDMLVLQLKYVKNPADVCGAAA